MERRIKRNKEKKKGIMVRKNIKVKIRWKSMLVYRIRRLIETFCKKNKK
jgi:hypothetical protein